MMQSVFWLTLANLAMRGVSMIFQVYLSGQMGPAGLGLLQLIMTVHAFSITLGSSGTRVASMYLCAEEYGHGRLYGVRAAMIRCVTAGLILSATVGTAMILGAAPLARFWVKDLRAIPSLRLLGLTLPLTCLSSILAGYFTACGKIKQLVIVEIADRLASVGLTVMLLNRGSTNDLAHACKAIVGGGAIATLGSTAVLGALLLKDLRQYGPERTPLHMTKRLLRFCIPVALNDYLRSGLGTLEQFLIPYGLAKCSGSRNSALADYGTIHGMVFPVLMFLSTVLYAVADLLVPKLARYKATGDRAQLQAITARCLRISTLFSLCVAGVIFVLSKHLGVLLYHSETAGRYLKLFAPLLPILYLDCIVDGMHKGLGQQVYCVRINTLTNCLDVLGLYFLLPHFGIGGYFFTYAATHVLNFLLSLLRLIKVSGFTPDLSFLLRAFSGVAVSAGAASALLPDHISWSTALVCGGFYFSGVFLIWILIIKGTA